MTLFRDKSLDLRAEDVLLLLHRQAQIVDLFFTSWRGARAHSSGADQHRQSEEGHMRQGTRSRGTRQR